MLTPFFCLILLTGFVFMVIWAMRFATKMQLKHAISWFLAIGIIGTLLSGSLNSMMFRRMGGFTSGFDAPFLMMGGRFRNGDVRGSPGSPAARGASSSSSSASALSK